jgi:PAS domain S-box-containing protein
MARFQRGFHSAPIGMALVGLDGRFMEVNLALSKMVDCPEAQLLSSSIRDVLHVEDRERFDVAFNQLGTGELGTFRLECRLVGLADRQSWALLTAAPVEGADGHAGYVIVHAEEITLRMPKPGSCTRRCTTPLPGFPIGSCSRTVSNSPWPGSTVAASPSQSSISTSIASNLSTTPSDTSTAMNCSS